MFLAATAKTSLVEPYLLSMAHSDERRDTAGSALPARMSVGRELQCAGQSRDRDAVEALISRIMVARVASDCCVITSGLVNYHIPCMYGNHLYSNGIGVDFCGFEASYVHIGSADSMKFMTLGERHNKISNPEPYTVCLEVDHWNDF